MASVGDYDNVFKQLVASEEKANLKHEKLVIVKAAIKKCQVDLCEMVDEKALAQGQLLIQMQKLSEEGVEIRQCQLKMDILNKQKNELQKSESEETSKFNKIANELHTVQESFCSDVSIFIEKNFGENIGQKSIENEAKRNNNLLKEEEQLATKISYLKSELETRKQKESENGNRLKEIRRLRVTVHDCDRHAKAIEKHIASSNRKREHLSTIPQNNSEFIKLRRQLEEFRSANSELSIPILSPQMALKKVPRPTKGRPSKCKSSVGYSSQAQQQLTIDQFWKPTDSSRK